MLTEQIWLSLNPPNNSKFQADQTDLLISLETSVFAINRSLYERSGYITYKIPQSQKFHIITEPLNQKLFKLVLDLFQGRNMTIKSFQALKSIANIINYLEIDELKQQINQQIVTCFRNFDVFILANFAFHYSFQAIFDRCLAELAKQQFEQMNYQRFDLMKCPFSLFQIILRRHLKMKQQGNIKGQPIEIILEIIKMYCSRNHQPQEVTHRLLQKYVGM